MLRIYFNDYYAVNLICSVSLIFIMFYGGFGTNLSAARPVAVQSVVLSTLGVAGTAALVAAFAHWALELSHRLGHLLHRCGLGVQYPAVQKAGAEGAY